MNGCGPDDGHDMILELIRPIRLNVCPYDLESRQLSNGDLHSLDFAQAYNGMCMTLFKSLNIDLVKEC